MEVARPCPAFIAAFITANGGAQVGPFLPFCLFGDPSSRPFVVADVFNASEYKKPMIATEIRVVFEKKFSTLL